MPSRKHRRWTRRETQRLSESMPYSINRLIQQQLHDAELRDLRRLTKQEVLEKHQPNSHLNDSQSSSGTVGKLDAAEAASSQQHQDIQPVAGPSGQEEKPADNRWQAVNDYRGYDKLLNKIGFKTRLCEESVG